MQHVCVQYVRLARPKLSCWPSGPVACPAEAKVALALGSCIYD